MGEEFVERHLPGARFRRVDLTNATFEQVHLRGARFHDVDLSGVRICLLDPARAAGRPVAVGPLDLPWDEMPDTEGVPRDRDARPSLDEALALRADRMATVRSVVDGLTDEQLAGGTEPVPGPGWPPAESFPVREVLLTVIGEEWWHRRFAERDLDVLVSRSG
jgi:hypothetical protein